MIPKCAPFWLEIFKIASVSYVAPPEPLVVRGFLPSALNPPLAPKQKYPRD